MGVKYQPQLVQSAGFLSCHQQHSTTHVRTVHFRAPNLPKELTNAHHWPRTIFIQSLHQQNWLCNRNKKLLPTKQTSIIWEKKRICTTCTLCHFLVTNNISSNIFFISTSISKNSISTPQHKAFLKRKRDNQRVFEWVAAVASGCVGSPPCPKDRHPNRRRTAPALPGSVSFVTISEMRRSTSHRCSWQPATVPPRRDRAFPRCWLVIFEKKTGGLYYNGSLKIGEFLFNNPEGQAKLKKHASLVRPTRSFLLG